MERARKREYGDTRIMTEQPREGQLQIGEWRGKARETVVYFGLGLNCRWQPKLIRG